MSNRSRGSGSKFGGLHKIVAHLGAPLELFFPVGPLNQRIEAHIKARLEMLLVFYLDFKSTIPEVLTL
jgi:hypothetical protein